MQLWSADRQVLGGDIPPFAIVICSKGRPDILTETVRSLARQSVPHLQFVLVVPDPEDVDREAVQSLGIANLEIIHAGYGTPCQRNAGIRAVSQEAQYVCFFDDDMEVHPDYIRNALLFLEAMPTVVALSGRMLSERGMSREQARELVENYDPAREPQYQGSFRNRGKHWVLHGCNMVLRAKVLALEAFDERLPLYANLEEYDVSVRIRHYGYVGRLAACVGVHLSTPSGRMNGRRVGYSKIANNWYMLGKGVCHVAFPVSYFRFVFLCAWHLCANSLAWLRKGDSNAGEQFKGNVLAVWDVLRGKSSPEKILQIP